MKKNYLVLKLCYLFIFLITTSHNTWAQTSTETFETESNGSSSFTDNGVIFNIISHVNTFDIGYYPGTGWNGTANDNTYIDNSGSLSTGASFSIKTTSNLFRVNRFWVFLANIYTNQNSTGTLTITGKLSGITKFSQAKTNGFATSLGTTNGNTLIDLTNLNGQNYSNIIIDELQITAGGNYAYLALDAFTWVKDSNIVSSCLNFTTEQTNIACNGGATGIATVTPSGGTPPYTYLWSNNATTSTISGLTAGNYSVTITDAASCEKTQSFTITQPPALSAFQRFITNVTCNGGTNGSAAVSVTGGTGAYTYLWNTTPVQTTATATGLPAGTYTVTVKDGNNCTTTQSFTITQPSAFTASIGAQTNVSCNGGTNGSATVNVTGGTGTYTYLWAPSGGTGATASGLTAGTYTVIVKDANLCQTTQSFTITQPSLLEATISKTDVLCNGGLTGTATVIPTGGSGNYTYIWSPSGGTAPTATGLPVGNYSCLITDAKGCSITKTITINQPSVLGATTSQINATCTSSGQASVTPFGGVGGYTFLWSPSGDTTQAVTNLTAGNHSCLITDANGCSITKNFTITTTNTLVAAAFQTNLLCNGVNTGSAAVIPLGAPGPFTYVWSPSGGNADTATNLSAGNYSVTITASNGCSIVKNFTITQPAAINITPNLQTNVTCNGGANGSAGVSVTGGTGAYTYSWFPSGGTAATASGLKAGTYTVTVTDANLCSKTQSFTITEPAILTAAVSQTNVSCHNGSNGTATATPAGGTGTYTYLWTPSGGTNATASGLAAGNYTVTIKDANLCQTTANVTITEPDQLTAAISKTDVLCNQANNGTATVIPTGGTAPYTFSWSPSGGTASTATGLSPNNYTVTVTDAKGCFTTKTIQITEPNILSITESHTNVSCNAGNDGSASVIVSGGTGSYTYSWTPSGGTAQTVSGLSAGTYTVTATDTNACSISKTITITEPDALTASITAVNVSCNNGKNGSASVAASGGTGSYTYNWAPSGGNTETAEGLAAGAYTVTITDTNSCSTTKTITITEPDVLTVNSTAIDVSCYNGKNGSASVTVNGGTAPYIYLWSHNGATTSNVTDLKAGTYDVTVTDSNSCTLSATILINEPANPVNLSISTISGVTVSGATLSATASSDGINTDKGECLTEIGFVYASHANPTIADTKINVSAALGNFTTSIAGLRGNRTYYVKTYAINNSGFINYGNEINFTTEKYTLNITASSGHVKVYGTSDPIFNYSAAGFANGDTNSLITGQLSREAGENVGKYNITQGNISAGADYIIAFTTSEFEITKANQNITWNQTLEFGCDDATIIALNAVSDSGLPVSFTIANDAIGKISGSTLTILNSGSTTISAFQNGDQNHNAAVPVIKPVEISQGELIKQQWADVIFFDNKSNEFNAWQWYKNGNAVTGATRQYYSEEQPLNGSYYVIAKNTNGNSIKSCPIETTGTAFSQSLKIHPNPIKPSSEFTLACDFSESQLSGSEITIFDVTGRLVQTITNVKPQNQIIAPSQSAIYVVVLSLHNGQKKTINLLVK